jgi:hypothetical protein
MEHLAPNAKFFRNVDKSCDEVVPMFIFHIEGVEHVNAALAA